MKAAASGGAVPPLPAGIPDALLARLAKRHGTPLFVYDFDAVEARVASLAAVLPPPFEIAYAVKANPSLGLLAFLARLGLGADVATRGELAAVLRAGFPAAKVLATGPAKSDADLLALATAGVGQIHVEGPEELERLEAVGRRLRRRLAVGLRLNPPWGIAERRTIIGGPGAKKFGFDLASARRALATRGRFPHLDVGGFQVFNASNVLDARLLARNAADVLELSLTLARQFDVPLRSVDFGGGLGVPYSDRERPLDLARFGRELQRVARTARDEPLLSGTRLVFEPGRFLVAEAGVYVVRVLGTKRSRGVDYALVDGGVHQLLRPALLGAPHRVRRVGAGSRPSSGRLVVAGPLCTSLDILHPGARLSVPERGDLLAVENAGAYGYTESMPLFLSHEPPLEIGVRKGRAAVLRRPFGVEEQLDRQTIPFRRG